MKKIKIIVIILILLFASPVFAGTYYVDDNGTATWADCEHNADPVGPKSGANACSMKTANKNAKPGDVVYIRGGSYRIDDTYVGDNPGINPANSGEPGNPITFIVYGNETATFTGDGTNNHSIAIYLRERSYIRVSGLDFELCNQFLLIDGRQRLSPYSEVGADYNVIDHCTFKQVRYDNDDGHSCNWRGSTIYHKAVHNWIHDCTFQAYGAFTDSQDVGVLFELGIGTESTDQSNYNTIENCHMYQGGHHVLGVNTGRYNVVRNNNVHNESWYTGGNCAGFENGVCGYRVASMTGTPDYSGYTLVEDNKFSYGAAYGGPHAYRSGGSGSGLSIGTSYNIVRYNDMYGNAQYGARFGASIAGGIYNHLYNNTFYHNGYGADDDDNAYDDTRGGLSFYRNSCDLVSDNVVKNNLFYDQWSETHNNTTGVYYPAIYAVTSSVQACNTIEHNYVDDSSYLPKGTPFSGSANPKFVDPDISDPTALTLHDGEWTGKPNLSLQASSPAIDGGTYLTQANGAGSNSTTLIVDDARYFQDGTWGSSLATLNADYIAIGTVSNTVQISSINYGTNTITLASAMTWADNAPVWLYKKSDGEVVLYKTGPDMGAHEYIESGESGISPPQNLQIVK